MTSVLLWVMGVVGFLVGLDSVLELAKTKAGIWKKQVYPFEKKIVRKNIVWLIICCIAIVVSLVLLLPVYFETIDFPAVTTGISIALGIFYAAVYSRNRPTPSTPLKDPSTVKKKPKTDNS